MNSIDHKDPSPTPPHKGEGLLRRSPRVLSPLVGEMAGRPEGDFSRTFQRKTL